MNVCAFVGPLKVIITVTVSFDYGISLNIFHITVHCILGKIG
jgi:hypothetical protein